MNNLKTVSPGHGGTRSAFAKITYLYTLAFVPASHRACTCTCRPTGLGLINMWVAMPLDIIARCW
jgi:NNP family nitrate/nitrite transporter-like MFS transporter